MESLYEGKGTLILDRVTPIIKALFGGYQLGRYKNGKLHFLRDDFENCPLWLDVLEALGALAVKLKLPVAWEIGAPPDELLEALALHFGVRLKPGAIPAFVRRAIETPTNKPSILDLDILARSLDDGHGLRSTSFTGTAGGFGDNVRWSGFYGETMFAGSAYMHVASLGEANDFAKACDKMLRKGDLGSANEMLAREIYRLFLGILDEGLRESIRATVLRQLLADDGRRTGLLN